MAKSPRGRGFTPPQKEIGLVNAGTRQADHVRSIRARLEEAVGPIIGGNQRGQVIERVTEIVAEESFSGPVPHPKHLAAYEDICPGLADRFTAMAEIAQKRAEDRRDKIVELEYGDRRLGMCFGFAALIVMLVAGVVLAALGNTILGGGLLSAAILGAVVTPFINGRPKSASKKAASPSSQALVTPSA
jgi:uncharacterized membrane protein